MAAGNIKGITIEFRGDTTDFQKAIRTVQSEGRSLDSEMRKINNALKFNPGNITLLSQKFEVLRQKIDKNNEKLETLKKAQKEMDAKGVDKSSKEYRELQREIVECESKQKAFNAEAKKIEAAVSPAGQFSAKMGKVGGALQTAGEQMMKFSAAGAAVVGAMAGIAYKAGKQADDLNTLSKRYGIATGDLQKYQLSADLVDVSVESIATSQKKLAQNMSKASKGSKTQSEAFDALGISVVDADGNLRDADDVFNEAIKKLGKMEAGTKRDALAMDIMGKSAQDLNPLIEDGGKTYEETAKLLDKYDLDMIDQETLDRANAFNDDIDKIKLIGTVTFQTLGSTIAASFAPVLEKVVDLVGRLANWFANLSPTALTVIGAISGVVAVLGPLLIVAGKVATAISAISGVLALAGTSFAAIAAPVGIAIAVITALIAVGVLLYKNWDTIKTWCITTWDAIRNKINNALNAAQARIAQFKVNMLAIWNSIKIRTLAVWNTIKTTLSTIVDGIKTTISEKIADVKTKVTTTFGDIKKKATTIFEAVKSAMTNPIETARELISKAIAKIQSIFDGLDLSLPKIKLPHFSISGGKAPFGIGGKGSLPEFHVNWNAEGAIFRRPTILQGVGEAGPEAVVPLNTLWNKLDRIADGTGGGGVTINVYGSPNMSVTELAEEVEKRMTRALNQKRRAWA